MKPKDVEYTHLSERLLLNVYEAASYSGLGITKIREMMKLKNCPFKVKVGECKEMINRKKLEQYIDENIEL